MLRSGITVTVDQKGRQPLTLVVAGELTIGRDCLGLILPDPQISRRHVTLRPIGNELEVVDHDSTNGTFLDQERLGKSRRVRRDATLVIGSTTLRIEFTAAPTTSVPVTPSTSHTIVQMADDPQMTSIARVADLVGSSPAEHPSDNTDGDTSTIVFSDIESSTERATAMGDEAWFALLEAHNTIFHEELTRCGGHEVKSLGDGFMLTFPSVRRALRFTSAVQRRIESPDGPDLRVRMGLHTGEAITDHAGDLFGRHVNLAARVANLAGGGQVLASLVVHEIASGRDDIRFGPPTRADLKGFEDTQTVYELLWDRSELGH